METSPVTCRTLEKYYHIDCHTFEKQYKEVLSRYRNWEQLSHADEWMLFPENIGPHLAIDETSLSNGAPTFYEHYDEILNFYNHRSSNAMAESFNAKIKLFRANLRGLADKRFFLFRIAKLYAYPH